MVFQSKSCILTMAILIPVRVTCHENRTGSSQHISVCAASKLSQSHYSRSWVQKGAHGISTCCGNIAILEDSEQQIKCRPSVQPVVRFYSNSILNTQASRYMTIHSIERASPSFYFFCFFLFVCCFFFKI